MPDSRCIALIADIVSSRSLAGPDRNALQEKLSNLLAELDQRYSSTILSGFVITAGDEFQALLSKAQDLPSIIWDLERSLRPIDLRIGIGCGTLDTPLRNPALGMDGPAWHLARDALNFAKSARSLGGVFRGFGDRDDEILSGFAILLRHLRERLSGRQFEVLELLRHQVTQRAVATELGITNQAISKQAKSAGWEAYRKGEGAWRTALGAFDYSLEWGPQ